jgi:hypothetical protein
MIRLAFGWPGTADDADAVFHFLYSESAFKHPEHFLNHWAKPVFVLFTAPIAQFGMIGLKIYNIGMLLGSMFLTWKCGQLLGIKNSWIGALVVATAPMSIYNTLSGLTEPMFAFWLILGVYFFLKRKWWTAVLWLSFLPFVRSEGLIVFCVLAIYLIAMRKFWLVPFLMVGHVVYGAIGYFLYEDFLWVFRKMSYATLNGAYGSGPWNHFLVHMPEVIGSLWTWLLAIGIVVGGLWWVLPWFSSQLKSFFKKWMGDQISQDELWLTYGIFIAYFVAHSMFWYYGIFNSYGMLRVLIGVFPMAGLIIARLFHPVWQLSIFEKKYVSLLPFVVLIPLSILSLNGNFSKSWHLDLTHGQRAFKQVKDQLWPAYEDYVLYYDAIYPAMLFEQDWFEPGEHRMIKQVLSGEPVPKNSLVLWDNTFAKLDGRIPLESLSDNKKMKEIGRFRSPQEGEWYKEVVVFEWDSSYSNESLLFEEDYEDFDLTDVTIDTTLAVFGNKCKRVDIKNAFSQGFSGMVNTLYQDGTKQLKFTFKALTPELPNEGEGSPNIVFSFENSMEPYEWTGVKILPKLTKANKWQEITVTKSIPEPKAYFDEARVYIWNPGHLPLYIDDLKLELLGARF